MATDREELISPPLSVMDQPSPKPNVGEVLPPSPTILREFNDEKPPIPISEPAIVAPAYNNGGGVPPELTNRSEPITLAKRSLLLTAQTAAAIVLLPVTGFTSAAKILLDLAAVLTILAYVCCVCAVWLSKSNPRIAGLMGEMSTACAGVSFLVTMGFFLPQKLIWIVVLNCLVLVSVFTSWFIN